MNRIIRFSIFVFALMFFIASKSNAQITIGANPYTDLKSAFTAINDGVETGAITINVNSSFAEPDSATLNASGTGAANYTSVLIKPTTNGITITGNTPRAVINLLGADNVTIDGRVGVVNTRELTIINNATTTLSAVIKMSSMGVGLGATFNTVMWCNIQGGINTVTLNIFGIYIAGLTMTATGTGADNDDITISNNIFTKSSFGIYSRGTSTANPNQNTTITNNIIGSDIAASYITLNGVDMTNSNNVNISNNKIYNIIAIHTVQLRGIFLSAGMTNVTINANEIGNIQNTTTTSFRAGQGIWISGTGAVNATISNNSIYGLHGHGSTTATNNMWGIVVSAGNNYNIYYNSISLTGSGTATGSVDRMGCIYLVTAASTGINMRNNALYNTKTPGNASSGFAYNVYSIVTSANLISNYNDYYGSGTRYFVGQIGATDRATLADWQTGTGQDANSINGNPMFVDPTSFLAILSSSPCLNAGDNTTGITTDILGVTRSATTPTIGAYENFVNIGPAISYTTLANTSSNGNRNLNNVTITDPEGIASGANAPRVYWRVNGGSWSSAATVSGSSPYDFVIGTIGLASGDVVEYFVVAQDLLGAVTANPSAGFSATDVNNITTYPTTPNSYIISSAPLSGTYTVGLALFNRVTGKNIYSEERTKKVTKEISVSTDNANIVKNEVESTSTSLNAPNIVKQTVTVDEKYSVLVENGKEYTGSLFYKPSAQEKQEFGLSTDNSGIYATITAALADLNLRGVSGNTTLLLVDATYPSETYPLMFNVNNEALPSSSATITLKPDVGVTSLISGSFNSGALVKILNNYVTIDGSNSVGGTTRDLTITNTSTTGPSVLHFASVGTTPITNGTVKNCILINGINTSTALVLSDNVLGTAGYFNNMTIQNNSIQRAYIGAYNITVPGAGNGSGLLYVGNDLTTSGADAIRFIGIYIQGVDGATVSQNQIANFDGTSAEDDRGVWLATATVNTTVERNFINTLKYTGTGGYGCNGITVSSGTVSCNNVLKNNSISDLSGDGWNYTSIIGDNTHGLYLFGTQTGIDVFYNSINLSGNTLNQTSALSTGICLGTGTTAELKNNIIVNNLGLLAATGYGSAGIFVQTSVAQLESSDYNDIYVNPSGSGVKAIGKAGTTDYVTIQDWRTASLTDENSISWDPQFVSATNLLPQSGSVNGTAFPIASVSNDILGNPRSTSVSNGPTDMGAYEIASGTATTMVQTINADGSYGFGFGGTIFGQITINGFIADAPFDISWIHYSGMNPPSAPGGSQYAVGYDSIWISNGSFSASSYNLRINVPKNSIFNIVDTTHIVLAKSNNGGANWTDAPGVGPGSNGYIGGYPSGYAFADGMTSFSLFAITSTDAPLPVELASFTSSVTRNIVKLNWTTTEEQNNAGFDIERKPVNSEVWNKIGNVVGNGNSSQPKNYSFTDNGLNTGSYNYRLKQIDFNGNFQYFNLSGEVIVGVPNDFKLSQNYPNPFNPTTKIDYDLPVDSKVNMRVYDMLGREVASLVNEQVTAGYYTVQLNATNLASGTYFFRLVAQGTNGKEFVMTKKMQLIK